MPKFNNALLARSIQAYRLSELGQKAFRYFRMSLQFFFFLNNHFIQKHIIVIPLVSAETPSMFVCCDSSWHGRVFCLMKENPKSKGKKKGSLWLHVLVLRLLSELGVWRGGEAGRLFGSGHAVQLDSCIQSGGGFICEEIKI